MATTDLDYQTAMAALETVEELIVRQRARVVAAARRIRPGLTERELAAARALPQIAGDPAFRFEDGQLAGLRAARIALQARLVEGVVAEG